MILHGLPGKAEKHTLHSKLITPPLDPGGGWQPSVIRQRGGVGLLNVHLCAWGWGWRASVMQHPGGVGGFGWSSWSGGGVGKTCQGGVGAVACGRGGGALAPRPNCHNLHLKCPSPIPIPTPPIPNVPQCPFPIQIPTNIAGGLIFSNTSGSIFSMGAPRLYQHILGL